MPDKTYAKFILNGQTYLDLSSDTVDSSTLLRGYTAHNRSGEPITGLFDPSIYVLKSGDTMSDKLSIEKEGFTSSDSGRGILQLGNDKDKGTQGNSHGALVVYGESTKYTMLLATQNPTTSANMVYLPSSQGILALVEDITSAINALDGSVTGTAGSGKTLTALSQTNGVLSATFGDISITKSQVSDFPTLATVATSGSYTDLSNTPTITDANVLQTVTASSVTGVYSVLFSDTAGTAGSDPSTITSGSRISGGIYYQPSTGSLYLQKIHTGTSIQQGRLVLGNGIADETAGACEGRILIYGKGTKYAQIMDSDNLLTNDRTLNVPDVSGIIATTNMTYSIAGRVMAIPANANLNTSAYTECGKYYCTNTNAATLTNCPITNAYFVMTVENPLSTAMGAIGGTTSNYRRRVLYGAYNPNLMFIQSCSTSSSGVETYGSWYKVNIEVNS